jgi:hypothetical protein
MVSQIKTLLIKLNNNNILLCNYTVLIDIKCKNIIFFLHSFLITAIEIISCLSNFTWEVYYTREKERVWPWFFKFCKH